MVKILKTANKLKKPALKSVKNSNVNKKDAKKFLKSKDLESKSNVKKIVKKQALEETNNDKNVKKQTVKIKSKIPDIEGIRNIDPEFYEFLKENDKKLLEFNVFDSDDSDGEIFKDQQEEQSETEEEDKDEKFHKPLEKLEVPSDESDFEDEQNDADSTSKKTKVTLNILRQWQMQLETSKMPIQAIRNVVKALNAALVTLSSEGAEDSSSKTPYKVEGSAIFDGVVSLCVLHLKPAIWRVLGIKDNFKQPLHKTNKWKKVRSCLRYYIQDLSQLLQQISSPNILTVLLKHLHQMSPVVACFSSLAKTLLKRLITLWATDDETVRVVAFLCILKITRKQQGSMLHHVLKAMYMSYVRNSKFVSATTLPCINFMRRSLVEMFSLDLQVSYHHAFLYIRQLAIHLRNALVLKKKDSYQAVYNWQYINSLRLWSDLLASTAHRPQLQPLIYPLITLILGVVRLIPTVQYFPLRFHCIQMLIHLSKHTSVYIPLLPLLVEVLRSNTFNEKHKKVSMRPMEFTFLLRLNKSQLSENGFRDETVEQMFALTLEYLAHESNSLAFSDLVLLAVINLKKYLKKCRNANYSRKIKQLVDKIKENADFINQERQRLTCGLQDLQKIQIWENEVHQKGTPLNLYYSSWIKTHETKKRRQAAAADKINTDYDLPSLNKTNIKSKSVVEVRNEDGQLELFPDTDSDTDMPSALIDKLSKQQQENELDDNEIELQPKKKKQKKEKLKKMKQITETDMLEAAVEESGDDAADGIDIVKDLDLDDW